VLGVLAGFDASGAPLVSLDASNRPPQLAQTTLPLRAAEVGSRVVLAVGVRDEVIVTGVVRPAGKGALAPVPSSPRELSLDGERLILSAEQEIVLRCGQASITLTADGKIVVRGADVLQVSSGLHRIQGSAVEIN
jgi:hypothetical protein